MATEHESSLDAPIQPGGVPRHASAKERRGRGLKPFLSDLRAEVQNQLSRTETPARPDGAPERLTEAVHPAGAAPQPAAAPQAHPHQPADAASLAAAALATADQAGTAAEAARAEAGAARSEAAAARIEAATAHATAARADAQLQAARAEIEAAHNEFEALRTEFDATRERTRQHLLVSWAGAGAAALLAVVAIVLAS